MNASGKHFIASCPNCATKLKIKRKYAGLEVMCRHCRETFLVPNDVPPAGASGNEVVGEPAPGALSTPERVACVCPTCLAVLSIRRVYIGSAVKCAQCSAAFMVPEPAEEAAKAPPSEPAATQQPAVAAPVPESMNGTSERTQPPLHVVDCAAGAPAAAISPCEVPALLEERDSLRAAVSGFRDQLRALSYDHDSHEQLVLELDQRDTELAAALSERDALERDLEERTAELAAVAAERAPSGRGA